MIVHLVVVDDVVLHLIFRPLADSWGGEVVLFSNEQGDWHIFDLGNVELWRGVGPVSQPVLLFAIVVVQKLVFSGGLQVMQNLLRGGRATAPCLHSFDNARVVE